MAYRTLRGRSGLTRAAVVGEERHNIFRPDTTQISVADRVSKLSLTTASLNTTVEAQIRWLLGEIEKSRFDDNALQLVAYASSLEKEKDGRLLALVLDLVFWKFREDLASRSIFSRLCQIIAQEILPTVQDGRSCDVDGQPVMGRNLVHQYILERCHREIGRMWLEKCRADNASLTRNDEAVVVANQATKQWAGLVRFIHALFEKSLVGEEVMHLCIERLLSPNKLALEEISALGDILSQVPGRRQYQSRERMNAYYVRIKELASSSGDSVLQDLHLSVLQSGPTKPILEYKKFEQGLQTQPESQHVEINTPTPSSQSKLKITPATPLSVIMDIFGLFSNVKDYTSELNKASYCSSSPVAFGGFSEVYQATLRHGAQVAVKCVKSSVSSDYEAVKHTARELDAWSKLRHANILELLGMA
ncbi:hypothetical protein BDV93DRAFT_504630 [Ceratobasidium sp. AG-I]|nr:hypothetical protein BDV93DRAFT_504630 [Ceratobasidium sp. AG-I]